MESLSETLDKIFAKHAFIDSYELARMAIEKAINRGNDYYDICESAEVREITNALQKALCDILNSASAMEAIESEVAND